MAAYGTGKSDDVLKDSDLKNSENKSYLSLLFSEIAKLESEFDDFIVRPLYIHPDHFNLDILPIIKNSKCFVPYFDIPFQSGDDEIIKSMNRVGTSEKYIELVKNIKSELPNVALRTTFLVGFPGETDKSFENTCNFLKEIKPMWSGCFSYSREENTPAYNMKKRVSSKVADKRVGELHEIQQNFTENDLKCYVGLELSVIIEEVIQNNPDFTEDASEGLAIGRAWFQAPDVDGCAVVRYDCDDPNQIKCIKPGNVIWVKVLALSGVDLDCRFLNLQKDFGR